MDLKLDANQAMETMFDVLKEDSKTKPVTAFGLEEFPKTSPKQINFTAAKVKKQRTSRQENCHDQSDDEISSRSKTMRNNEEKKDRLVHPVHTKPDFNTISDIEIKKFKGN